VGGQLGEGGFGGDVVNPAVDDDDLGGAFVALDKSAMSLSAPG
jgi:hypothetical protein